MLMALLNIIVGHNPGEYFKGHNPGEYFKGHNPDEYFKVWSFVQLPFTSHI